MQQRQPSTFTLIGRADELADLQRRLADPDCRLLTLIGPGGIGKTRLAMVLAHAVAPAFPDGVTQIFLQPVASPESIVPALAEALGVQFFPGAEPLRQILDYLEPRKTLLLFDNFEHLSTGASILTDILAAVPELKILVTSREALQLPDEWLYTVDGLACPPASTDDFTRWGAVSLFVHRARRLDEQFSPATDQESITRICRLVGGMPLALELAAAWVRTLSCAEIADEIERGYDILSSSSRHWPEQHRSMGVIMDQSWNRLTDDERRVLMMLSVFHAPFTRAAAAAVSDASREHLLSLLDRSWLRRDGLTGRYALHELLRQYAAHCLDAEPLLRDRAHEACITYYVTWLESRLSSMMSSEQRATLLAFDAEVEDIRAVWFALVERRRADLLRRIVEPVTAYFWLRRQFAALADILDPAIAVLRDLPEDPVACVTLGLLLLARVEVPLHLGNPDAGRPFLDEGLALVRQHGGPTDLLSGLKSLISLNSAIHGWSELRPGEWDWSESLAAADEAMTLALKLGDRIHLTELLVERAWLAFLRHQSDEALTLARESYRLALESGNPSLIGYTAGPVLGRFLEVAGDYDHARELRLFSNQILIENGFFWDVGHNFSGLGYIAYLQGDSETALRHFRESIQFYSEAQGRGRGTSASMSLANIALVWAAQGHATRAVELLAFILVYPDSAREALVWARERLDRIRNTLTPQQFDRAVEQGRALDLDTVLAEILNPSITSPHPAAADDLTDREREILGLIADGLSNREIADRLIFSIGTVKWYANQIYVKLGVSGRTRAIARARELGLLS